MNMFIYDENGNLTIRKPNGLEYSFNNTDKPDLGFEYDVVVYDDIEVKILKWEENKCFDCLLYTSPSPRDATLSRMPSSA